METIGISQQYQSLLAFRPSFLFLPQGMNESGDCVPSPQSSETPLFLPSPQSSQSPHTKTAAGVPALVPVEALALIKHAAPISCYPWLSSGPCAFLCVGLSQAQHLNWPARHTLCLLFQSMDHVGLSLSGCLFFPVSGQSCSLDWRIPVGRNCICLVLCCISRTQRCPFHCSCSINSR